MVKYNNANQLGHFVTLRFTKFRLFAALDGINMEQLHRAQRYLDRMREIYEGCPHKYKHVEYYEDDVISFFINCYHLLDWLIINNPSGYTKEDLNDFLNSHLELKICADLCNGKKHCQLNRTRSGEQPSMNGKNWMILTYKEELKKPITFINKYVILHQGKEYDALELAEKCMSLWRNKIREMALKAI